MHIYMYSSQRIGQEGPDRRGGVRRGRGQGFLVQYTEQCLYLHATHRSPERTGEKSQGLIANLTVKIPRLCKFNTKNLRREKGEKRESSMHTGRQRRKKFHSCLSIQWLYRHEANIRGGGKNVHVVFKYISVRRPAVDRGVGGRSNAYIYPFCMLNMKLDLQSLFGLLCSVVLFG